MVGPPAALTTRARTLADLLIRRTKLAFETRDHGVGVAAAAADYVAPRLGWTAETVRREVERYGGEVERIFGLDPGAGV